MAVVLLKIVILVLLGFYLGIKEIDAELCDTECDYNPCPNKDAIQCEEHVDGYRAHYLCRCTSGPLIKWIKCTNITCIESVCSCNCGGGAEKVCVKGKITEMEKVIIRFEGSRSKVYKDTEGKRTVGVGFNMDQADGKKIFNKHLPGVSFEDVLNGKTELTECQILKLFQKTLKDKIQTTKNLFNDYDKLPKYVQIALVNAVFRGEMKSGHKTVKLINAGKWSEVVKEYLDRDDYREASKEGSKCPGIKTRMDYNAAQFRKYAKELAERKK